MSITIKATDVNRDGTGINFASYFANFENTFTPTGRGQFSGADMISGAEYALTDANGYGVVLDASETPWNYSMTTHTVVGSLDGVSFGGSTVLNTSTRTFSQKSDIDISGLGIEDNGKANLIRSTLSASNADELLAALKADTIIFAGSAGADVFKSYGHNDRLSGGAGNDTLWGNGGNDVLTGGDGNDTLVGGIGNDTLYGNNGNDIAKGGDGLDVIKGGANDDKLYGEAGNDKLYGEAGNDLLSGGAGIDRLFGGAGNNTLTGGADKDYFYFDATATGRNVVTDFDAGATVSDVMSLDKDILSSFADVKAHATENTSGITIDYGDGSIILRGVELADLHRNDFLFA